MIFALRSLCNTALSSPNLTVIHDREAAALISLLAGRRGKTARGRTRPSPRVGLTRCAPCDTLERLHARARARQGRSIGLMCVSRTLGLEMGAFCLAARAVK
jgi:hypothetical protein